MLFNSLDFAIFLPLAFGFYWLICRAGLRIRNLYLVGISYFFYGCWDWRFLFLIALSSSVDYSVGLGLEAVDDKKKRKLLLLCSIVVNVGILCVFKYFNFFADNFRSVFSFLGYQINDPVFFEIILPVGISFYTFQTMSYSIDVYKKKLSPTKDPIAYFAYVSFFPQLVAGPIERATHLLPQFFQKKTFQYGKASDGMRQILWGLFQKIVIADNCAVYVDRLFSNYQDYSGSTLLIGAMLFAFQIYADFAGYSNIAIGTASLFGFDLMSNFKTPYFARDIAEFWRRWHISLTTWFRDYIYIPLGGSRVENLKKIRNVFCVFLISGFWHGANWTFIAWGLINAIYFMPLMLMDKNRDNLDTIAQGRALPSMRELLNVIVTFLLVTLAWVFFRSETIGGALAYLSIVLSPSLLTFPEVLPLKPLALIALLLIVEWSGREKRHPLQTMPVSLPACLRWGVYYGLVVLIYFGGHTSTTVEFIYFKF